MKVDLDISHRYGTVHLDTGANCPVKINNVTVEYVSGKANCLQYTVKFWYQLPTPDTYKWEDSYEAI